MDDQLAGDTERLVDAVCAAATAAAMGRQDQLRDAIRDFGEPTKALSRRAAEIGKQCGNGAAVAKALVELAQAVNACAAALTQEGTGRTVAEASVRVGNAVEGLAAATDLSTRTAVLRCIDKARTIFREDLNEEVDGYPISHIEGCVRDVTVTSQRAATATIDKRKRDLLMFSLDELAGTKQRLVNAKTQVDGREKASAARNGLRTLDDIDEATKIVPNFGGKLDRAMQRVQNLLDQAGKLKDLGKELCAAQTKEQVVSKATEAAKAALGLVKELEETAAQERDPVRRRQLEAATKDLRAAAVQLLQSAKTTAAARTPEEEALAREQTREAMAKVERCIDRALAIAGATEGKEGAVLADTCQMLHNMVDEMAARYPPVGGEQLMAFADDIEETTNRVVQDAKAMAAVTEDPELRNEILQAARVLRERGDDFASDVRQLARNGGDSSQIESLASKKAFTDQLEEMENIAYGNGAVARCRSIAAAEAEALRRRQEEEELEGLDMEGFGPPGGDVADHDLVVAAREQAQHAESIAAKARQQMGNITDAAQRQRLQSALDALPEATRTLVEAAERLARNPDDPDAIRAYEQAQSRLTQLISEIMDASGQMTMEMEEIMREMREEASESEKRTAQLVGTCDDLFNKIQALVDNMTNMDAAQIAASQQEISKTVNELCAMLRQQAKECENPAMAEQLIMLSKVLKDKMIQMKMICAVKMSQGGSQGSGQVESVSKGLQTSLQETSSVLRASAIASRSKNAKARANAFRNLARVYKQN